MDLVWTYSSLDGCALEWFEELLIPLLEFWFLMPFRSPPSGLALWVCSISEVAYYLLQFSWKFD